MPGFIDTPSFAEILTVLFVALLLFGGKLPEMARKLGRGVSDLKKNLESLKEEIEKEEVSPPTSPPKVPPVEPKKSNPS